MRIGGFPLGNSSDLPQEAEMWYHFPCTVATIFTFIGVHFFDLITLLVIAAIIDFSLSILKYLFVFSYKFIYYSIGHSIILWIWGIGTLIYFIIAKPWWMGAYALSYHIFIGSIVSIPGILIVDGIAKKIIRKNPKYYAAEIFHRRLTPYINFNSSDKDKTNNSEFRSEEQKMMSNELYSGDTKDFHKIFCRYCGKELPYYAVHCKYCGKKQKNNKD